MPQIHEDPGILHHSSRAREDSYISELQHPIRLSLILHGFIGLHRILHNSNWFFMILNDSFMILDSHRFPVSYNILPLSLASCKLPRTWDSSGCKGRTRTEAGRSCTGPASLRGPSWWPLTWNGRERRVWVWWCGNFQWEWQVYSMMKWWCMVRMAMWWPVMSDVC